MIECKTILDNIEGLHLRPSLTISQIVNQSKSKVTISTDKSTANAESIMEIAILAAGCGEEITIVADGEDEIETMNSILGIISKGITSI